MSKQKKKKKSDPNAADINPDLIEIATKNGLLRSNFNLFLSGTLTYQETLELMVLTLYRDYKENKILLNKYIQRKSGIPTPPEMIRLPVPKKLVELNPTLLKWTNSNVENVEDAQVVS